MRERNRRADTALVFVTCQGFSGIGKLNARQKAEAFNLAKNAPAQRNESFRLLVLHDDGHHFCRNSSDRGFQEPFKSLRKCRGFGATGSTRNPVECGGCRNAEAAQRAREDSGASIHKIGGADKSRSDCSRRSSQHPAVTRWKTAIRVCLEGLRK